MKEKKKTWADYEQEQMAQLESLSMHGDLVAFFNSKEEAENHVRQLYFLGRNDPIVQHYQALKPRNKKAIEKLVATLSGGREHQGFNLQVYLYWVTKHTSDENKLRQIDYARQIVERDIAELKSYDMYELNTPTKINHRLNDFKKTAKFSNDALVPTLCDDLLVSKELILTGRGMVEDVKDEILQMFIGDTAFTKTLQRFPAPSVREAYSEFAKHIGKTWDEIVDKKYVILNFTRGYEFLKKTAKELVDYMIEELYFQQMELEEAHQKVEAAFFEQMLKNGGAVEIDPDEDPNE